MLLTIDSTYARIYGFIWLRRDEMLPDLEIFTVAGAKARHAAARQMVIARNVANADTPGYRAEDVEPFDRAFAQKALAGKIGEAPRTFYTSGLGAASPNGNSVSLEDEMMRAAEAVRDHELASTIYAKALSMMRTALGTRR